MNVRCITQMENPMQGEKDADKRSMLELQVENTEGYKLVQSAHLGNEGHGGQQGF